MTRRTKRPAARSQSSDPANDSGDLRFPEFHVYSVESLLAVAECAAIAAVVYLLLERIPAPLPWLKITLIAVEGIFSFCAAVPVVAAIVGESRNALLRRAWVQGFPRAVSPGELGELLRADPNRYAMHWKGYGAFGWTMPDPAYLLQDRQSGELLPIHPARGSTTEICVELGVPVHRH